MWGARAVRGGSGLGVLSVSDALGLTDNGLPPLHWIIVIIVDFPPAPDSTVTD